MQRVVPVLQVASLSEAERFYGDALGFQADWVWQPEADAPGFAQVSRGGLSLYLAQAGWQGASGPGAAYLYVDDVDHWHRELERAGVAVEQPPVDRPWGNRELALRDPDGNRLTLATPQVPVPGDASA